MDFVILYKEKGNFVGASIARPQGLDDFLHRATMGRLMTDVIELLFRTNKF